MEDTQRSQPISTESQGIAEWAACTSSQDAGGPESGRSFCSARCLMKQSQKVSCSEFVMTNFAIRAGFSPVLKTVIPPTKRENRPV